MNFHDDLIFRINDEKECVPVYGLSFIFNYYLFFQQAWQAFLMRRGAGKSQLEQNYS